MRFYPGQKVVCNTTIDDIHSPIKGDNFDRRHAPQFNQIYTVREYFMYDQCSWLLFIAELSPTVVYDEDLFDPLDEAAVIEAQRILSDMPVEG